MRIQDIILGETYKFKAHPETGYAKAIATLKPKEGVNDHSYSIIKCRHTSIKNGKVGFIRYFRPDALIKI